AVDHQVHLAQVLFDEVDGLVLDLVGKGVAIDAFGVEASLLGAFMEGGGVVPAGGAGLALGPFLLEENAEGGGPGAKGGGDAGGEAVAGGGADHQHPLGAIDHRGLGFHVGDLVADVPLAAHRVGGDTHETAHSGLDDHCNSVFGYVGA